MKIIKTTTPLDTIEYDGDYPVELRPSRCRRNIQNDP